MRIGLGTGLNDDDIPPVPPAPSVNYLMWGTGPTDFLMWGTGPTDFLLWS